MSRTSPLVLAGIVALGSACSGPEAAGPTDSETSGTSAVVGTLSGTIIWDSKSQMKQVASTKGCDSWTPTWAGDGNLYSGYGDCQMAGVPVKLGMGFARISGSTGYAVSVTPVPTGDPANWNDAATGAGLDATGNGTASEKPAGMLQIGTRLWASIRNVSSGGHGVRLKYTDNYTTSSPDFTWVTWTFTELGYAAFVQYGKGYSNGPASYVYAVVPMRSNATGSVSTSAYDSVQAFGLLRGARADLKLRTNWKYFCGTSTTPSWCTTASSAKNIYFKSGTKFRPRAGMSWNAGLARFMLTLIYDPYTPSRDTRFYGALMVLTAPNPWGPWQIAFSSSVTWPGGTPNTTGCGGSSNSWGAGDRADIPTKYMSADGKSFYVFSSGGDCLSIAHGVLP